ncbi:hypothetical protein M6B38_398510 [Iris pallida]|uniref:Uncharacterized protein n=1 Tax=Iris pallida TaxID=29817 RepID=A0AAX6FUG8_IRIPA|nr:hypothetical protein M6B38_398510 [Iris pallida]
MARSDDELIFHGCGLVVPYLSNVDELRRGCLVGDRRASSVVSSELQSMVARATADPDGYGDTRSSSSKV